VVEVARLDDVEAVEASLVSTNGPSVTVPPPLIVVAVVGGASASPPARDPPSSKTCSTNVLCASTTAGHASGDRLA
jgi:hypothetical protein